MIAGTVNNAHASYADIAIDPNSVKFPELQCLDLVESKSGVCTVLFFTAPVSPTLQAKTEQVMYNMLKRAVDRAVERGCDIVQFVDVSPSPDRSSQLVGTLQQLAGERKDIKVEFMGTASVDSGIKLLTQPLDIVLGVRCAQTVGIIEFVASREKAIASYIPETGEFDRRNLPSVKKNIEVAKNNVERDRV